MKTQLTKWLTATLVLSTAMSPSEVLASEPAKSKVFVDLENVSKEKQAAIAEAVRQGLLTGNSDGQFRPADVLTRQELAVLLSKALHLQPVESSTSSFRDVSNAEWGLPYIEAVRQAGLMVGDEHGAFRPYAHVTREELAATFVRAIQGEDASGGSQTSLRDTQAVSPWARDTVNLAFHLGLIDVENNQFHPKGQVQRQDIAKLLLDIFQAQEHSAEITGIEGDVVTIDGVPYLIEGKLKQVLGAANQKALQGATLTFNSINRNVDSISELRIIQSGATLDVGDFAGTLVISANNVVIKGSEINRIVLEKGVSSVQVDTQVAQVIVNTDQPLQISGSGTFAELQVSSPSAKIKLGQTIQLNNIKLPDKIKLSQIIENLSQVTKNVKTVQQGIDDRNTGSSSGSSSGSSGGNPKPVNHAPKVKNGIAALTKKVSDGAQVVDLTNAFEDEDRDELTYTAASDHAFVASVSITNRTLTVTPLKGGTATVTVTAKDPSGASVATTFVVTVQAEPAGNHAPKVDKGLSNLVTRVPAGNQPVPLADAFKDEDGDALTYKVLSSDDTVVTVSEANGMLTVTPHKAGTATITVTAKDPSNATVTTTFVVTVEAEPAGNHVPKVDKGLSNLVTRVSAGNQAVSLTDAFKDEDSDTLSYGASSSDDAVVTVSEANGTLTVTPLKAGTATITVTAKDPSNATVTTTFVVTVEAEPAGNHVPKVDKGLSNLVTRVSAGNQAVSLTDAFKDEDGDTLSYGASSSDDAVVTVSEANGTLTVTPMKIGTATITVTAKDPSDATVTTTFVVTVEAEPAGNHAPKVDKGLSNLVTRVSAGNQTVPLADAFKDEDGDALTYKVLSSDDTVVTVSEANGTLTPLKVGTATITVTAKDPSNATVTTTFVVTVEAEPAGNHAPKVKNGVSDLTKNILDGAQTVDLSDAFEDEDALTYSASSSDDTVVTVSEANGRLTVTPLKAGTATITVTAKDSSNEQANTTFTVTLSDSTVFFSETYWDTLDPYLQAFELFNPTGEDIDLQDIRIEYSLPDGTVSIVTPTGVLQTGQTYLIGESLFDPSENYPDVKLDWVEIFWFFEQLDAPTTLYLYYKNNLVDITYLTPFQDLKRASKTVKGDTSYDPTHWNPATASNPSDLGKYDTP
ncbi:UNVERIFIED_CONTAM: uncharacterized protein YkvS [Brevibacillus sp. OAP136]